MSVLLPQSRVIKVLKCLSYSYIPKCIDDGTIEYKMRINRSLLELLSEVLGQSVNFCVQAFLHGFPSKAKVPQVAHGKLSLL